MLLVLPLVLVLWTLVALPVPFFAQMSPFGGRVGVPGVMRVLRRGREEL